MDALTSTRSSTFGARTRRWLPAIACVAAVLALGAPAGAFAAVRYVDDTGGIDGVNSCTSSAAPCLSLQHAVNQAIAGDTVELAAGTYSPGAVIDKANLTISGAGEAATQVSPTAGLPRAFDLRGSADGVTIQDLRMVGPYTGVGGITDRTGVHVPNTVGLDVADLTLRNLDATGLKYAIDVRYPGSATGWTVDSVDARINEYGARTTGATTDLSVTASHFDFNDFGLYVGHTNTTPRTPGVFDDVEIADTTFDGNAIKGLYLEQASNLDLHGLSVTTPPAPSPRADVNPNNGIDVNVKYGAFANIRIADSVFGGATGAGVLIHGRNDAPLYSPVPGSLDNVDLERLTVTGNSPAPSSAGGINVSAATTNVSVSGSRIVGNGVAGLVSYADAGPGSTIAATDNWWGCNEGPTLDSSTACSAIVQAAGLATIDADPWLLLSASASPVGIATGGATSDVTAALATNSAGDAAAPPPDGTAVAFATDVGSIAPGIAQLAAGRAVAVLTSDATAGTAHVTASLDAAQATADVVIVAPPAGTTPPVLSGGAVVGSVLSCSLGAWAPNTLTYTQRWLRNGVEIPGRTGATYATRDADVGRAVACSVTATNTIGASLRRASNAVTVLPRARAAADAVVPVLTGLRLSHRRFLVVRPATRLATRKRRALGTAITFRLSESATVTFRIDRVARTRRCVRLAPNRNAQGCERQRLAGTLTRHGASGRNTPYFSGRIDARALRPGRYRLTVRATDAAGNRSRATRRHFTII